MLKHEWIGLTVEIVDSLDPTLKGRQGRVIDETKNTLVIEEGTRRIRIPKAVVTLKFILPGGKEVLVDGRKIVMRPEERVKRL